MEKIKYSDIDFSTLEELDVVASRSKIYTEKDVRENVYKIFNNMSMEKLKEKTEKVEIFSSIKSIDSVVTASALIENKRKTKGIKIPYVDGIILNDFLRYNSPSIYLYVLLNISKDMKKIHNLDGKPVIGDMHFNNLLVDVYSKHYFIDTDSWGINNMEAEEIPTALGTYLDFMNYREEKNSNSDRVSFMLALFNNIFDRNLLSVGEYTYDTYSEKYEFLYSLKDIFMDLKMSHANIPDIPYLHEILDKKDINNQNSTQKLILASIS